MDTLGMITDDKRHDYIFEMRFIIILSFVVPLSVDFTRAY